MWNDKVILVVEDFEANYLYIEAALEESMVKILWAKDGIEAVDICKTEDKIDLILMDIQMPRMNGFDATRIIKGLRKELPIIAQTAYAMENDREKILNAGCDDYVAKPIKVGVLLDMIGKYIGEN